MQRLYAEEHEQQHYRHSKKSYTASSIYFSYIAPGTHDLKLEASKGYF